MKCLREGCEVSEGFLDKPFCLAQSRIHETGRATFESFMKTSCLAAWVLLLVGCSTTTQRSAALTSEQASTMALRLANEKASDRYDCQPFRNGQPARLVQGYWVWTGRRGFGQGDIEATVEIAPDGLIHTVDLQLLNSKVLY